MAVLAVVLYHAGVPAARGGYVGVDVFFVVSGFLITGLVWKELAANGRVSFGSFYARRARRLLPASALVIVVTLVASRYWLSPLQMTSVAKDGIAGALYVVNYRFAADSTSYLDAGGPASPLQHYWSLAVEEQFYLLWPALLVATARLRQRAGPPSRAAALIGLAALGTASLGGCVWLTERSQPWAFFSLPTRAWEFVAGGLVALAVPQIARMPRLAAVVAGWGGMLVIAWSVMSFRSTTTFPGLAALLPVAGTAAVLTAGSVEARWGPTAVLRWRPFQAVGRITYGWYLWHWPVLVIGAVIAGRQLTTGENLALVAAAAPLASLMLIVVEDPARYSPVLVSLPRRTLTLAAVLTVLTATTGLVLVRPDHRLRVETVSAPSPPPIAVPLAGPESAAPTAAPAVGASAATAPTPSPPPTTVVDATEVALSEARLAVAQVVAASIPVDEVPGNLEPPLSRAHGDRARPFDDGCFVGFKDSEVHRCRYGADNPTTRVVLFGDSHATAWFPAFEPVALAHGWQFEVPSKATCPPLIASVWSPNFERNYDECDSWREKVLSRFEADPPMLVVLGMNRNYGPAYGLDDYGPEWLTGLGEMVTTLTSFGTRVVVIGPLPRMPGDVPNCLSANLSTATACSPAVEQAYSSAGIEAEQEAVEVAGGYYLDVRPAFCDSVSCATIVGNLLVYRDQNHITTDYAAWLSPLIGAALAHAQRIP